MDEEAALTANVERSLGRFDLVATGMTADIESFDRTIEKIRSDPDLTGEARTRREQALRAQLEADIQEHAAEVDQIHSDIADAIERALAPSTDANVRLVEELGAQRALRALDGGTPLERIVEAAAQARDLDLLNGLLRALPTHPTYSGAGPEAVTRALGLVATGIGGRVAKAFELRRAAAAAEEATRSTLDVGRAIAAGRREQASMQRMSAGFQRNDARRAAQRAGAAG